MQDSLVIGIFILVYLGIIVYITKKSYDVSLNKDKDEFFHGGRKFGFYTTLMTLVASLFSAYTFVGLPGFFYTHGIGSFLFITLYLIGFMPLVTYYVGMKMLELSKKHKGISPVEILTMKYNRWVKIIAGIITTIFLIPFLAIQPIGVGKLLSGISSTYFPYLSVVFAFLVIVYMYSRFGGMRTIVWSDALQGTIMIVLAIIVAGLFVNTFWDDSADMFNDVANSPSADLLSLPGPSGFFTYQMLFSFFVIFVVIPISFPYVAQRNIIFKDEKTVRKSVMWYPIVSMLVVLPALFIGIGGAYLSPDLASGDDVLSSVLLLLDNPIISSLIIIAIIAAAMSTVDSMYLAMGSIFSRDIYSNLVRKKKVDDVVISSIYSLVVLFIIFGIAINPPTLIVSLGVLAASGFLQLVPAYLGSLYWEKSTNSGAILSMLSGVFMLCVFHFTAINPMLGFHAGFVSFCLASIVFVVVSLLTSKK